MSTYVLVDTANTFFRARHVVRGDLDTKVGMALHITLNSIKKAWQDFDADHVVFCLEGRSWRKDFYEPYKRNRQQARDALTVKEAEEDKVFWEIFDEFKDFIGNKTNCTMMQHPQLEADDLIAGWVQAHPKDTHIIISTDGDFAQLIAPNVKQYNGVSNTIITHEGYFDDKKRKPVLDKNRCWHIMNKLDLKIMKKAAKKLIGTHDFSTFRASSCRAKSPIKTMKSVKIKHKNNKIEIEFQSQSFLQQQVRSMVGCLKYVGEEKWTLKKFINVMTSKKRNLCAPPAPPEGLYLARVIY